MFIVDSDIIVTQFCNYYVNILLIVNLKDKISDNTVPKERLNKNNSYLKNGFTKKSI